MKGRHRSQWYIMVVSPRAMERTEHDLGWSRIEIALRARCKSPGASDYVVHLAESYEGAALYMRETKEALDLLERGDGLPLDGLRDVGQALLRVERHGALDGPSLHAIAVTLEHARRMRRFLGSRKEKAAALAAVCVFNPTLDDLEETLSSSIDVDGTVSDRASHEIRRLREEASNIRTRVVAKMQELAHKHADILSDGFHTLRDGRYVLPVRSDAHERLPGIVHASSASGATVFVEPRLVVGLGNRLKIAVAELEREELRILGILSEEVREQITDVKQAVFSLEHADLRNAGAKLAIDMRATFPDLLAEPELTLHELRHPLLVLDGVRVVPSDLRVKAGAALIISGPNAGGKTVALKAMGLCALMLRAGLAIPVRDDSSAGFFAQVLTDIGDEQSIEKNLSTFSAHVSNVVKILAEAGKGSLVLLDELATGTDPAEGGALASGVLDALCRAGATVATTTHYESLKALALTDSRMTNAAVGFDLQKMAPTFELRWGVPGASSALSVARRFGMPSDVLTYAENVLPQEARDFEALVAKLDSMWRELRDEKAAVLDLRGEVERAKQELTDKLNVFRARDSRALSEEAEKTRAELRQLRGELDDFRKRARAEAKSQEDVVALRNDLRVVSERVEQTIEQGQPAASGPSAGPDNGLLSLEVGTEVWVARLRSKAEILEPVRQGRVRVAAGAIKLTLTVDEISALPKPGAPEVKSASGKAQERDTKRGTPTAARAVMSADNTLDLRGLRVDDGLLLVDSFVDRLYGASEAVGFILHGVGTGAMRDAVREHLARLTRYIDKFETASEADGGARTTRIVLKS